PWKYLGWKVLTATIEPQQIKLQTDVKTLNGLQKLLGTINWVKPHLGITNTDFRPLF
ncbi:POK18 protein, partial [Rhinopomastus cyanomelas]|nr:POK18 protein [Rhinopomastus cyanomelas]